MAAMEKTAVIQDDLPWSLESNRAYLAWRERKLDNYAQVLHAPAVRIADLANPSESERAELIERCRKTNLAIYRTDPANPDAMAVRRELRSFVDGFGLKIAERHRSAGEQGIVALTVTDAERQRGYIPYSRKAINWHTDGYYNAPDEQILAMVLHCVRPAADGGVSQLMDNEIAYIRLRDRDPALIEALMHPEAMSIPENAEPDGSLRPVSVGPVFSVGSDGKLTMRYTARTRSISWRDDATTRKAAAILQAILTGDDPLMLTAKLAAGQGVLCNNVLHNRTAFDPDTDQPSNRLFYRVRFHNRVKGS
ncbi:MAG: TauD/TfdA family dioxygenase [Rhodobacteraceae bacterium]|nr:TauD/TfdA family dioxygenase [Paracoccaceae bacterium]